MKSQKEILDKINAIDNEDFLGFIRNSLIDALTYENAKQYLNDGVTKKQWDKSRLKTDKDIIFIMKDYLDFAYEKAEGQRGISANRSINHYQGWSFLIDDDLYKWITTEYESNYHNYGMHILDGIKKWLDNGGEK